MASNHNPFAPPSQEAEAGEDEVFGEDEQLVNASRGTRFVNSLIDNFGQWLLALLMGGMVGGARALFGVGPSEERRNIYEGLSDFVLAPFARDERDDILELIPKIGSAIETWLREGPERAMNAFNRAEE